MRRAKVTWIVVADGARGRILAASGAEPALSLVRELESEAARKRTRELGTERPGRVRESAMTARHAMEPRADWHRQEEEKFAALLAQELAHAEAQFDALILVAPPRALGDLRQALDAASRKRVVGELAKDLTSVPVHDLPDRLTDVHKAKA